MPNVINAQWARFVWVKKFLNEDKQHLIDTFNDSIRKHVKNKKFRGHDSGDFFSQKYIEAWHEICFSNPNIRFWFPTRSWRTNKKTWIKSLTKLANLPNVVVRPSALKYNEKPPQLNWLSKGSTVYFDKQDKQPGVLVCLKSLNGGSCEDNNCYKCWDNKTEVGYIIHGRMGKHKITPPSKKEVQIREDVKQKFTKLTVYKNDIGVSKCQSSN